MIPARLAAPHLLAGALCAGLALALGVRAPAGPAVALAVLVASLAALAVRDRPRLVLLALALVLCGWWWGSVRLDSLDRSVLAGAVGRVEPARLVVTGPVRRSAFSIRTAVRVVSFGRARPDERAWLELPPARAPPQGAVIETVATVRAPRGPEAGTSFVEADYLRRQGIQVVLRAQGFRVVGRRHGLGGLADTLHGRLARTIAPGIAGERRAVLAGIVLGDDQGLTTELRDAFQASGLYHLLAVSGANIAFVVGGLVVAAWLAGLPRWAGHVGALVAVLAYVLAVGWQPSVVRAGVAGVLASLAWLASRPADRWHFLLVGAAVLLAWNPYSLREPGFQLSFAAVASIFVAVPRLQRRLAGYPLPRMLADGVAVSVACGLATAPVLWLHFGAVPVYSVLSNAVAAPVVAPLFAGSLATAVLAPVLPPAAAALAWCDGWLAAYLAAVARCFARLPFAQASAPAVLGVLAGIVVCALVLVRLPRPRRGRVALLLAVTAAVACAGAWLARPGSRPPPPPPTGFRLTMLDVGQGDSILLQVPQGAVLVDEGPPEADVARQLRRLGVRRLAALVVTHPHRDHVGGAAEVIHDLAVGFVLDPLEPGPGLEERAAREAAHEEHVRIVAARRGESFRLGRLRLRVVWPDGPGFPGEDPHDHCVVILASYGSTDVLLTGDAESPVTLPLHLPPVEILKVAHHGSADPTLPELLARVHPRIALVSVGRGNDYGHPRPSTIAALERVPGLQLYRTDEDGRIEVDSDGSRIEVTTQR